MSDQLDRIEAKLDQLIAVAEVNKANIESLVTDARGMHNRVAAVERSICNLRCRREDDGELHTVGGGNGRG